MILSIIIPVYNVQGYLKRCVDSCLRQDILGDEYEIIIINDGSTDDSLQIIESNYLHNQTVKIISQENGGLSNARNSGLAVARGDYVWFVDSDDWIKDNCLKGLCSLLIKGYDVVQLDYLITWDDKEKDYAVMTNINGCISGVDFMLDYDVPVPAQFCIYRREMLLKYNLSFYEHIVHEDVEFKPKALYYASTVVSNKEPVYFYYQRQDGSISSSYSLRNVKDSLTALNSIYDFSKDKGTKAKRAFASQVGMTLNTILSYTMSFDDQKRKEVLDILNTNIHLFEFMFKSKNIKYKMESLVSAFSIRKLMYFNSLIKKMTL